MKWAYDRLTAVLLGVCYITPLSYVNWHILRTMQWWNTTSLTPWYFAWCFCFMLITSVTGIFAAILFVSGELYSPHVIIGYCITVRDRIDFCLYSVVLSIFTLCVGFLFLPVMVVACIVSTLCGAVIFRRFLLKELDNASTARGVLISISDMID